MSETKTYRDLVISDKTIEDMNTFGGEYINSKIIDTAVRKTNISNIRVKGMTTTGSSFKELVLGASTLTHLIFGPKSKIDYANIHHVKIKTAFAMISSTLKRSIIADSTIENGEFINSHFKRVAFINTVFVNCKFHKTTFAACTFSGCAFIKCKLTGFDKVRGPFISCDFAPTNVLGIMHYAKDDIHPNYDGYHTVENQWVRCESKEKNVVLRKCYNTHGIVSFKKDIPSWINKVYSFVNTTKYQADGAEFHIIPKRLIPQMKRSTYVYTSHKPETNPKRAYRFYTAGV